MAESFSPTNLICRRLVGPIALLSVLACLSACSDGADTLFQGGTIYSPGSTRVLEAVAVKDDRIVFAGPRVDAQRYVGRFTEIVDIGGGMLLPGLIDAHVHPYLWSVLGDYCPLRDARSVDELMSLVEQCAAETESGWVKGFGWRTSLFEDGLPTKELLDRYFPDRPVLLVSYHMHIWWLNSTALEDSGLPGDVQAPTGGVIYRDPETDELTGVFEDQGPLPLISAKPDELKPSALRFMRNMHAFFQEMSANGYVAYMDALVDDRDVVRTYWLLHKLGLIDQKGTLASLVIAGGGDQRMEEILTWRSDYESEDLRMNVAKLFIDGNFDTRLAYLKQGYSGSDWHGRAYYQRRELRDWFARLDAAGYATHVHVLGDGAIDLALGAFEDADLDADTQERHTIAHIQLADDGDLYRLASLGLIANISPSWGYYEPRDKGVPFNEAQIMEQVGARFSEESLYLPFASLRDKSVRIAAGSDFPFTTLNPFEAIETGMTRQHPRIEPAGSPFLDVQRLDLETLLAAMTIDAAYQLYREDELGTIEVGKSASLTLIDRDLFETPVVDISETNVLMTMIDGEIAYRAD